MSLVVIGDVHGKAKEYKQITKKYKYSVQIGDFGVGPDTWKNLKINPDKHKFFGGNHEYHDLLDSYSNNLGDFGEVSLGDKIFFFIRGAYSIDKKYQQLNGFWSSKEELSVREGNKCIALYETLKPKIVLSHTCPDEVAKIIGNPKILRDFGFNPLTFRTSTQVLLQSLFDIHQPDLWIFGHFHQSIKITIDGTEFRCLNELETYNL